MNETVEGRLAYAFLITIVILMAIALIAICLWTWFSGLEYVTLSMLAVGVLFFVVYKVLEYNEKKDV